MRRYLKIASSLMNINQSLTWFLWHNFRYLKPVANRSLNVSVQRCCFPSSIIMFSLAALAASDAGCQQHETEVDGKADAHDDGKNSNSTIGSDFGKHKRV